MIETPRPGDVFYADIGGDEDHRVVIVSREMLNRGSYVLVVPVTSKRFEERKHYPNCVAFLAGQFGFTRNCVARAERLALLEKHRLDFDRGLVGQLDGRALRDLTKAIGFVICADCEPL